MNTLFLNALACRNTQKPPIWLMRQAGRYMPEYRALRAKHTFMEMCQIPELITQVTHLPIDRFQFDAAILFSDILLLTHFYGRGLHFEESIGPIFERPIQTVQDVETLPNVSMEDYSFVAEAIRELKKKLKVPLIGFAGGPFTVASYLIEGKSVQNLKQTKLWMLRNPLYFHQLLSKIADDTIAYLEMQIKAGVDVLQLFDTWALYLSHSYFQEFSLAYLQKIVDGIRKHNLPVILFCRGSSVFAPMLIQTQPSAISLDWQCSLKQIREKVPKNIALQGNFDPDILYADKFTIQKEAKRLLDEMSGDSGYIFNLGHGINPDTPTDSVKTLIDCVRA